MALTLGILGAIIIVLIGFKLLGRVVDVVGDALRHVLGDLYDYAAIYFVVFGTIVAALAMLFFVVSLTVWIGLVFVVLLLAVVMFELL